MKPLLEKERDWCGGSITAGGLEKGQEQPSETARKIWKCKRSGDPGSRNRWGAGSTGRGVCREVSDHSGGLEL